MELRVRHLSGSKSGLEEVFDASALRLGREPSNDIAFDPHQDIVVSGRHAELSWDGRDWVIRDLGSSNGTFVDGERISQRALRSGDNIQLGRGGPRLEVRYSTADMIPMTALEDLPPRDFPQTVILGADDVDAARETTIVGEDLDFREAATYRQGTLERSRLNAVMRAPVTVPAPAPKEKSKWMIPAAAAAGVVVLSGGMYLALRPAATPEPKAVVRDPQTFASRAELDKLKKDLAARESQLNDLQQKVKAAPPQISVYASRDLDRQVRNAQAMIEQLRTELKQKNQVLAPPPPVQVAAAAGAAAASADIATPTRAAEETFEITPASKAIRKRLHVSVDESAPDVPESISAGLARSLTNVLATTGMYLLDANSGPHVGIGVVNYQAGQHAERGTQNLGKFRGTLFGRKPANAPPSARDDAYDVAVTASVGVYDAHGRQLGSVKPGYAVSETQAAGNTATDAADVAEMLTMETPLADTMRYVIAASADEVMRSTVDLEPEISIRSMTGDVVILDAGKNAGLAPDDVFEVVDGGRAVARARVELVQDATATAVVRPANVNLAGKHVRYIGVKRGEAVPSTTEFAERVARATQAADAREGPGVSFKTSGSVAAGTELHVVYTVGSWSRVRIGDRRMWVPTAILEDV